MNWKIFFKPTTAKIILFLILIGGINYLDFLQNRLPVGTATIGKPWGFWVFGADARPLALAQTQAISHFLWVGFIIDIVFYYIISCGIVVLYRKIRKNSSPTPTSTI